MFSPARGRIGSVRGKGGVAGGAPSPSPAPPSPALTPHLTSAGALRGGLSPLSPWSSTSTPVPARTSPVLRSGDKVGVDGSQPVFVNDFPQQLRTSHVERPVLRTDTGIHGGMEGKSGLSWVLHGENLFVWSHLNSRGPQSCAVLTVPPQFSRDGRGSDPKLGENWLVCIFGRQVKDSNDVSFVKACHSAGVIMCNKKTLSVVYWPDAFTDGDTCVSLGPEEKIDGPSAVNASTDESRLNMRRSFSSWTGNAGGHAMDLVNSLVASAVDEASSEACVAVAGRSNGDLWRIDCSADGISRQKIARDVASQDMGLIAFNSSTARSVVWRSGPNAGVRPLLLLTASGLECWNVTLAPGGSVSLAWSYDILGEKDVLKDLANHKQVWLLDLQVDDNGNNFTVLIVSFLKDRINSSSYMQYSLLTFFDTNPPHGKVIRKAPLQVILPKARVEEEEFLYSMRLRIGGKPAGSAVILSGDGTATITHFRSGSLRLYQFDLAWGAGKVLDASAVPPLEDGDDGSWLVLTEKAGVWAVPERTIFMGGVEPPERSLSRRGSSNEESAKEERRRVFGENVGLRRVSSETGVVAENREKVIPRPTSQKPLQDEEAEAIVGRLFHQYVTSGKAELAFEKLEQAGGFEREGEMNIFARTSRQIVDTLAKHWVAGGAGSAAVMAAVSSQLVEKQRRHQQYLNFLSVTKCHVGLQQKQRGALHAIMEHGEKLAAMVQLRELHNSWAQARTHSMDSEQLETVEVGGALWDTVQLVGEKARRNNVMLMDREKSEVFYTRVSDIEDFFSCIQQHATSIVGREQPLKVRIDRLCEIAESATSLIRTAIRYRDTQQSWYPSPEALTPWYCRPTVRSGVWKVATMILDIKAEASVSVPSMEPQLVSWLEEVADVLLEGYAGAITAKVEREEEYRGLQMEYWNRRDTLFTALQQHAKAVANTSVQHLSGDNAEQRYLVLRKLYPSLIALARRHAGYQTLFNICTDLNDRDQLCKLMHESMGLREGRFSHYVFEQLYKRKQYSKLLRFGEDFDEELSAFLQEHLHLRWLHELVRQQYMSACNTLHSVALLPDSPITVTGMYSKDSEDGSKGKDKLKDRRRLLYLAKLAALSGGDLGGGDKVERINANIAIIAVQEEAVKKGSCGEEILHPGQLVEVCLKSGDRDLLLQAFDVFAFAGESFRKGNKSLLEAAWLRAADQDNWAQIRQISEEEGWSDEHHWQFLQSTAIFQISKRCYGEGSPCYGAPFQEILPLLESDVGLLDAKGKVTRLETGKKSVEGILMQHSGFPDASDAMLTALRMGAASGNEYDDKETEIMVEV
ncbi:unnamed protein product [Calypogeia fissa]